MECVICCRESSLERVQEFTYSKGEKVSLSYQYPSLSQTNIEGM